MWQAINFLNPFFLRVVKIKKTLFSPVMGSCVALFVISAFLLCLYFWKVTDLSHSVYTRLFGAEIQLHDSYDLIKFFTSSCQQIHM